MFPLQIDIYETYNPGSITSIDLIPANGNKPIRVASSADKETTCPGVFTVKASLDTLISGVAIHLDQTQSASWDEIDAVEMIGQTNSSSHPSPMATMAATEFATLAVTASSAATVSP